MISKLKIENHEELVRDAETQAVLNTDLTSLEQYKARREKERKKENEVRQIRQDLDEMKTLLKVLVEKVK